MRAHALDILEVLDEGCQSVAPLKKVIPRRARITPSGWIEALINKVEYFGSHETPLIRALGLRTRRTTQQRTNSVSTFHYATPSRFERHSALKERLQTLSNRSNFLFIKCAHPTNKRGNSLNVSSKCFVEGRPFGKTLDLADYYVHLISRDGEKL